jgi:hypothetical protein
MTEAATITFRDVSTEDEGIAIVRYDANSVALGLSLKEDGDIEVVMTKVDAKKLVAALNKALL